MGVGETSDDLDLLQKSVNSECCSQLRAQDLYGYVSPMLGVACKVYRGHSAAADDPLELVTTGKGVLEVVWYLAHAPNLSRRRWSSSGRKTQLLATVATA